MLPPRPAQARYRAWAGAGTAAAVLLVAGCAGAGAPSSQPGTPGSVDEALATHVHGVGINPADQSTYLATHAGLWVVDGSTAQRIGPDIDLMGFAVAGPDRFLASGHPAPDTGLPDPAGLIESTDGGATWQPLSRQSVSDFHALAASGNAVMGFDSTALMKSTDGASWEALDVDFAPYSLGLSDSGQTVIATTAEGLQHSADGGTTWTTIPVPVLLLVDVIDDRTAVGITPTGQIQTSRDGGLTWTVGETVDGEPQALTGVAGEDGRIRTVVVTSTGLHDSESG